MTKFLLYLLLYTYTASILKPAMPYIADAVAHTFYYAEHVKTVHVENGKSHVHYESRKINSKSSDKDAEEAIKKISLANEHLIISKINYQYFYPNLLHSYSSFITPMALSVEQIIDVPPPKC